MAQGKTIKELLTALEVPLDELRTCDTLNEEFAFIRACFNRKALKVHPDKGGSNEAFRELRSCFEVLRVMYAEEQVASFVTETEMATGSQFEHFWKDFEGRGVPAYEFYESEASFVPYRVELAKSERSSCSATGKAKKCGTSEAEELIGKGTLRCGWMNQQSGSYGSWTHLACWRVPSKIWLGCATPDPDCASVAQAFAADIAGMEEVVLSGYAALPVEARALFLAHCMDPNNHARIQNRTARKAAGANEPRGAAANLQVSTSVSAAAAGTGAMVQKGTAPAPASSAVDFYTRVIVPKPGRDGPAGSMQGKTVVLSGVFPMLGGGVGLNLGKDKAKQMIQSFGGRVTGSVSGRTDILVVGMEPGLSKVTKARNSPRVRIMDIAQLITCLKAGVVEYDGVVLTYERDENLMDGNIRNGKFLLAHLKLLPNNFTFNEKWHTVIVNSSMLRITHREHVVIHEVPISRIGSHDTVIYHVLLGRAHQEAGSAAALANPVRIAGFSAGFGYNGLALTASPEQLACARGPPPRAPAAALPSPTPVDPTPPQAAAPSPTPKPKAEAAVPSPTPQPNEAEATPATAAGKRKPARKAAKPKVGATPATNTPSPTPAASSTRKRGRGGTAESSVAKGEADNDEAPPAKKKQVKATKPKPDRKRAAAAPTSTAPTPSQLAAAKSVKANPCSIAPAVPTLSKRRAAAEAKRAERAAAPPKPPKKTRCEKCETCINPRGLQRRRACLDPVFTARA